MKMFAGFLQVAWTLAVKDLVEEFRTRYAITGMALFSLTTLVAVSFSVGIMALDVMLHAALLWIIIFFSAMSALSRSFTREEESGTAIALRMVLIPEIIYTGKLLYNVVLLTMLLLVVVPLYMVMMNLPEGANIALSLTILITGTFCLAGVATILAAIVARAGAKNSLLPILTFPVLLPVLLTAIRSTGIAFAGGGFEDVSADLIFLVSFMIIVITASLLLFTFVWED